ncbi:MAG: phosphoribosylanthranilate isomerase [Phycisphaerales bacterium]
MHRTRIKICGIRDEAALRAAADAGADAVGFVFLPSSPRAIDPADAWALAGLLPPMVTTVGLTVDLSLDEFAQIESNCPTGLNQLHGDEPDEVVRALGPDLIKAVRYDEATIADRLRHYDAMPEVSAILVDGSAGGLGERFDWNGLATAAGDIATPLILAGGLTPENVGEAIAVVRPFAVDVSSGVERERGVKDPGLIAAFCRAVREADRTLAH